MKTPICKRCLLHELDGEYFKSIYQYIESLPQEQKVDRSEYQRRLAFCRECENLQNGLCTQCGCFAEVRAAKRQMGCPVDKWTAQ